MPSKKCEVLLNNSEIVGTVGFMAPEVVSVGEWE